MEEVVEALSLVSGLYHHHHHTRFDYHTFVESAVYNVMFSYVNKRIQIAITYVGRQYKK